MRSIWKRIKETFKFLPLTRKGTPRTQLLNSQRLIALTLLTLISPSLTSAQCAMCRAALESSGDNGLAEGINNGIIFLMAIPYILVAVIGYIIYRMIKKSKNRAA